MIEFSQHPTAPELDAAGEVIAATDWLGNRFTVGDLVMYCIGAGRGQMMAVGRVLKIRSEVKFRHSSREAREGEAHTRLLHYYDPPKRWVDEQLPYDDITVQVITGRTSGLWGNGQRSRPAWVNPMNVTALTGLAGAPHWGTAASAARVPKVAFPATRTESTGRCFATTAPRR
jgi:hypothetical protein